jgi:hypothetical protein
LKRIFTEQAEKFVGRDLSRSAKGKSHRLDPASINALETEFVYDVLEIVSGDGGKDSGLERHAA